MSDESDKEELAKIILITQGTMIAHQVILKALLIKWIMKENDPQAALRQMFEQISSDLDRGHESLGGAALISVHQARKVVEDIFSSFDQALSRRTKRRSGKPDQA